MIVCEQTENSVLLAVEVVARWDAEDCAVLIEVHRDGRVVGGHYPGGVASVAPWAITKERARELHAMYFPSTTQETKP